MKTRVAIACLIVVLSFAVAVPAMAAYYISISVTESNGTDYDMLAMNVTMDIDHLADNGFINEDGLDVRITNSQGGQLPFMLAEDKLMFASAIEGDKTTGLQMTTGNSPLDSTAIVVGNGGYATVSDAANLELGDDFEIEFLDAYIDTANDLDLIDKDDAFRIYTDDTGTVNAEIYGSSTSIEQTAQFGDRDLYSGSRTRQAQRLDSFAKSRITQVSFSLRKQGSPTGTAYVRVRRVSDDGIVGTLGTLDVSTLTTSFAWKDFTTEVYNPTAQDLRFTVEYDGGSSFNRLEAQYDYDKCTGEESYYTGSWTDDATYDMTVKIYWVPVTTVATTISSGEYDISAWADTTDFGLDIDGSNVDSVALGGFSVPDNANDYVIANIPYYDSYTHTTSSALRITYQPDDIISGTTLVNETNPGTYDGTITWGSNPAGISISTSGLEIEDSYYYTGGETSTTDIFEPEHAELVTGIDTDKLDHNPFQPGVEGFAEASNGAFTETLVWYGFAWFITIAVGIALIIFMREHLVFAASASFGLTIMFYVWGIFDYWVLIIFGIFFGASLIHERMPTW